MTGEQKGGAKLSFGTPMADFGTPGTPLDPPVNLIVIWRGVELCVCPWSISVAVFGSRAAAAKPAGRAPVFCDSDRFASWYNVKYSDSAKWYVSEAETVVT